MVRDSSMAEFEGRIRISGSDYNRIVDNELEAHDAPVVRATDVHHTVIARNTMRMAFARALILYDSDDNRLADNVFTSASQAYPPTASG